MKRSKFKAILSLALCLTLSGGLLWARWRPADRFDPVVAEQGMLRVMTWNVGYFAVAADKNMRDLDIGSVVSTVQEASPDVVVLQELGHLDQAEEIADALGEGWTAHAAETGHGGQVIAVLSTLPSVGREIVECGGRNTKGVTYDFDGQQLYVLGVHSPHPARGAAQTTASISEALDHARSRSEGLRIVAGDLNYHFDAGSPDELYTDILSDFGDGTVGIGKTYYAGTRIDHVFHYPQGLEVVEEGSGMLDLDLRFAGVPGFRDHRPIVVSYRTD